MASGTQTELTASGDNLTPVFSPDGRSVIFVSSLFEDYVIARASVDGSTPVELFIDTKEYSGPTDCSPDGAGLVYDKVRRDGNRDIGISTGAGESRGVATTEAVESGATFSPDGSRGPGRPPTER